MLYLRKDQQRIFLFILKVATVYRSLREEPDNAREWIIGFWCMNFTKESDCGARN